MSKHAMEVMPLSCLQRQHKYSCFIWKLDIYSQEVYMTFFVFLSACLFVCVCVRTHAHVCLPACIHAVYLTSVRCSSGLSMAICHHRNAFNGSCIYV